MHVGDAETLANAARIAVGGFFVLWGWFGLSTRAQLVVLVPIVILFPLWFFRYSRSLWLALEWSLNP